MWPSLLKKSSTDLYKSAYSFYLLSTIHFRSMQWLLDFGVRNALEVVVDLLDVHTILRLALLNERRDLKKRNIINK